MTQNDACQRYMEDPDANAAHLEACQKCGAEASALAEKVDLETPSVDLNALPLAPWEGSSHRAWPLVLGGTAIVVAIALALCDAAGLSPVHIAESSMASMDATRALLNRAASSLRQASIGAQIAFGAAFLIVNALLFLLLRRAPRGIDA